MAALTKNKKPFRHIPGGGEIFCDAPVKASAVIFEGAMVNAVDNGVYPADTGSALAFFGIAQAAATGGATDGLVRVRCQVGGYVEVPTSAISSVALTDMGNLVYADNDNDLTLSSINNSLMGRITNIDMVAGIVVIKLATNDQGTITSF